MAPSSGDEGANKPPPTDWAEVFADFACHTNITKSEIPFMTLPQIQAYRGKLGKNIQLKKMSPQDILGGTFTGTSTLLPTTKGESSQEDVESFFGSF